MTMTLARPFSPVLAARLLRWSAAAWFVVAAVGQVAFIGFILAFYAVRTLTGNFAAWNDKPLIDGYIAGDRSGNLVFAAHVLLASVVTLAGLIQMLPWVRRRRPRAHRLLGRAFLIIACVMALSGAWLVLVRGSYLSQVSSVAILGNGALILVFSSLAWRRAVQRRFDEHRLWAMRSFMVVSGVWFLRVGLMGWVLLNHGPVGMTDDMSGPADTAMTFGSYLIPLALLEVYRIAGRGGAAAIKLGGALLLALATLYTAVGVFGAVAMMWAPYVFR